MIAVAVVRPKADPIETTMSIWVDLLLPPGTGLPNVSVVANLTGGAATPAAVQGAANWADVVLYFGHGTEKTLGIPTLLDLASFSGWAGRVVIAVACLSSEELGPKAVSQHHLAAYLGFSEPVFVYNARPALVGFQLATRLREYLTGATTLAQARTDLAGDLKAIEQMYHFGPRATSPDAQLIWMGARMNWRGLTLS